MGNAQNALLQRPRRCFISHGLSRSLFIGNGNSFLQVHSSWKTGMEVGILERNDGQLSILRSFSTGFASVHGGKPSAEYARRRKQSLETEFRNMLGRHGSKSLLSYSRFGPFLALYRAAIISYQVAKLTVWHFFVQDIHKRAVKFRETLISLGPFYIKLGQALSTRPDILHKAYCQELSKLQVMEHGTSKNQQPMGWTALLLLSSHPQPLKSAATACTIAATTQPAEDGLFWCWPGAESAISGEETAGQTAG